MARIFGFIFILALVILGLFFGNINADSVTLDYYWGQIHAPLSVALVLSLLCGAIMGMLASLTVLIRLRHQIKRLKKEIRTAEKEVVNLRSIPLKEDH